MLPSSYIQVTAIVSVTDKLGLLSLSQLLAYLLILFRERYFLIEAKKKINVEK
jgi:hypothetical protein